MLPVVPSGWRCAGDCRQHLAGERCRKLWWQDHGRKPLADARVTPHGCGAFDAAINAASDFTAL